MELRVMQMGAAGVCVDKNPLELQDDELVQAANAITDSSSGKATLRKREGLIARTTSAAAGTVLGGVSLPLPNQSLSGTHFFYIGRGPT